MVSSQLMGSLQPQLDEIAGERGCNPAAGGGFAQFRTRLEEDGYRDRRLLGRGEPDEPRVGQPVGAHRGPGLAATLTPETAAAWPVPSLTARSIISVRTEAVAGSMAWPIGLGSNVSTVLPSASKMRFTR